MFEKDLKLFSEEIYLKYLTTSNFNPDYPNWLNNKKINKYLEARHFVHTQESCKKFIENCISSSDNILFGIFLIENNEHIGNIKVGPIDFINKHAEIGIIIGNKNYWGKKIATRAIICTTKFAIEDLGLKSLNCSAYESNIGSIKAFKKAGYIISGSIPNRWKTSIDNYESDILLNFTNSKINIPNSGDVILYGGGEILEFCYKFLSTKIDSKYIHIITSERLKNSFSSNLLTKRKINFLILNSIFEVNSYIENLKNIRFIVACGPDTGFDNKMLFQAQNRIFSLHPVLNSNYLGGAHESWQILNSEERSGFAIQHITKMSIENCSFIASKEFDIKENEKPIHIYSKALETGRLLIQEFFSEIFKQGIVNYNQLNKNSFSEYLSWPRLFTPLNGWIDWNWDCEEIYKFCLAFDEPYEGAKSFFKDKEIKLLPIEKNISKIHPYASGIITSILEKNNLITVAAKGGLIKFKYILPENSKLSSDDLGNRLNTPLSKLKESQKIPKITSQKIDY